MRAAAHELSLFVEDSTRSSRRPPRATLAAHGDHRSATTTRCSAFPRRDDAGDQEGVPRLARELHPDVSEEPDAEARFREVTEAYEVLSKPETRGLYDRFGHDGLSSGGFTPDDFDFTSLGDIFSAFFGEDIFGAAAPAGRGARRRHRRVETEIELAEAAEGVTRDVPFAVALTCEHCDGRGAEPGTSPRPARRCGGAGRLQPVSSTVFGQFVRTQACPRAAAGPGRPDPVPRLRRRGPIVARSARSTSRSRRASTTASGSASPARATPARSAAAPATSTSTCTSGPTRGSCATGTTSSRRST